MKPILIVGQGIAGTVLALSLRKQGLPFFVIDNGYKSSSSLAAAGLYNPLILKRGRLTWRAHDFFDRCEAFFRQCEQDLGQTFLHSEGLHRRIHDTEEYNNWAMLESSADVGPFVQGYVSASEFPRTFDLPMDTCKVKGGWLEVSVFLKAALKSFKKSKEFKESEFVPEDVIRQGDLWEWKGLTFSKIILCTGYRSREDQVFFKDLPFTPAKGHTMDIHWPGVDLDKGIQASVFILPLGACKYRVGSTYSWQNLNEEVESVEIEKLKLELRKVCPLPFTVLEERAGVRPAVKDRRPLLGESLEHRGIWHFGGFETQGSAHLPDSSTRVH